MQIETIEYHVQNVTFRGYLVYNEQADLPAPAVLIAPAWRGQDDFAKKKAELLAELGYVAFVVDVYGMGVSVDSNEEALKLMLPLFLDRKLLRARIMGAYQTVFALPHVDKEKIGAMGFCFGGLTVLELFKSGAKLKGTVSFHGLLTDTLGEHKAATIPPSKKLWGSVLILNGAKDPLINSIFMEETQKELTLAEVNWQMILYGQAAHAFTNPKANEPENGMIFHPRSEQRSLLAMRNFFEEVFE